MTTFAKMRGRRSNTRTTHDAVKRHRYKDINLFSTDKTEYEKTSHNDSCADCKADVAATSDEAEKIEDNRIVTTEEELQGFYIVRSILYPEVDDINRVQYRDTMSYFGILLDDNNRKPICRLYFNSSNKYLETCNVEKWGQKHLLESLDDIYKYKDEIIAACKMY